MSIQETVMSWEQLLERATNSHEGGFVLRRDGIATPETAALDLLRVRPVHKFYNGCFRVERVLILAEKVALRRLGAMIIAHLCQSQFEQLRIDLIAKNSAIASLVLQPSRGSPIEFGVPEKFGYSFSNVEKHPWRDVGDVWTLPVFQLVSSRGPCAIESNWAARDTLSLCGTPIANLRLGELMLNMGSSQSECLEVELEVEGGIRGVGPLSCEAEILLPGSFGWEALPA